MMENNDEQPAEQEHLPATLADSMYFLLGQEAEMLIGDLWVWVYIVGYEGEGDINNNLFITVEGIPQGHFKMLYRKNVKVRAKAEDLHKYLRPIIEGSVVDITPERLIAEASSNE